MKKIILAAALTLAAAPAFAGEGNGDFFRLRTPAIASSTLASAPDTGSEDAPNANVAFAEPAGETVFASNASEASVQTANSVPAGALDGNFAYAQRTHGAFAAR